MSHTAGPSPFYEIRVEGQLSDEYWSQWFEGLVVTLDESETILVGPLVDQAALFGLLNRIQDLGLPLLMVRRMPRG